MSTKLPRGLRNNNPLNIRIGNNWKGEVEINTDGIFEQFKHMKWGWRAAFILLYRYIHKYRKQTIRDIIRTWAPENENHTENYIKRVCALTGMQENSVVFFDDQYQMAQLVKAMAAVENGTCILDEECIHDGYLEAAQDLLG